MPETSWKDVLKGMNRLSDEKAQLIASTYCLNGFEKVKALLSVGYSKTYANNVGLKLFDNDKVKLAVARIQNVQAAKTGYTVEQAQEEYEEARILAMKVNQPAAAASATTGKARLYGFDKDAAIGEKTVIIISPRIAPQGPQQVDTRAIESKEVDNEQ